MEPLERIELLYKVATTINHDMNGMFIFEEMERLHLIQKLLKDTEYKLTEIGLCHLYSKIPIMKLSEGVEPITVISSHIDTHRKITIPFSELKEKKLYGTYDNAITNAAVLT